MNVRVGARAGAQKTEHAGRKKYYALLCVAVLIGWAGIDILLPYFARIPVLRADAWPLYINFFAWEGEALRSAFASLAAGNGFQFPMYVYNLGYGADSIVTMMDCINDPFNLVSVFFPTELAAGPYVALIPVRLALSAATFSWYCFERGHGHGETFVSSLCYTFGGFTIFWGALRHANFINWTILLPLILLGADRIFKGKKPTMFIVSMALMLFTCVYYAYMSCLVLLVYCLVKYFVAPRERSAADFLKLVGKFVLFMIIAFCISAVFALPSVMALLSQGRATEGAAVPLLFTLSYYASLGVQTVGGVVASRSLYEGAVPVVLGLVFLLCGRKLPREVRRPWFVALVLCWVGLLVPYVWHAFNGMGYPTDRWVLAYNFVCAYVVCLAIPTVAKLEKREFKRLLVGVVIVGCWALLYAAYPIVSSGDPLASIWPIVMVVMLAVVYVLTRRKVRHYAAVLACMVLLGVSLNASFDMTPLGSNYVELFPKVGTTGPGLTTASPAAPIDRVDDDTLFRQTYPRVYDSHKNAALTHDSMGVDFYSSFYNQDVDDFRQEQGMTDHYRNYSFIGNNSRFALETLTGAKYFVTSEKDEWMAPYGYTKTDIEPTEEAKYYVYKAGYTMPIGFATDKVVPRAVYEKLPMPDKQGALLSGIVIGSDGATSGADGANASNADLGLEGSYQQVSPESTAVPIDYEVTKTDGLTMDGNVIETTKENATMTLKFEGLPESETYVLMDELAFSPHSPLQLAELNGEEITPMKRVSDLLWDSPSTYSIGVTARKHTQNIAMATPDASGYGGKDRWLVNTGYSDEAVKSVKLKFETPGTYTLSDLKVYCTPVEPFVGMVEELGKGAFERLDLGVNRVEATVTVPSGQAQSGGASQLAFFTLANTPGWSATVDGKNVPVLKADTAFTAVEVAGEGTHEVVLTYVTPGLREGALLTVVGIVALIVVIIVGKRRARPTGQQSEDTIR